MAIPAKSKLNNEFDAFRFKKEISPLKRIFNGMKYFLFDMKSRKVLQRILLDGKAYNYETLVECNIYFPVATFMHYLSPYPIIA